MTQLANPFLLAHGGALAPAAARVLLKGAARVVATASIVRVWQWQRWIIKAEDILAQLQSRFGARAEIDQVQGKIDALNATLVPMLEIIAEAKRARTAGGLSGLGQERGPLLPFNDAIYANEQRNAAKFAPFLRAEALVQLKPVLDRAAREAGAALGKIIAELYPKGIGPIVEYPAATDAVLPPLPNFRNVPKWIGDKLTAARTPFLLAGSVGLVLTLLLAAGAGFVLLRWFGGPPR